MNNNELLQKIDTMMDEKIEDLKTALTKDKDFKTELTKDSVYDIVALTKDYDIDSVEVDFESEDIQQKVKKVFGFDYIDGNFIPPNKTKPGIVGWMEIWNEMSSNQLLNFYNKHFDSIEQGMKIFVKIRNDLSKYI